MTGNDSEVVGNDSEAVGNDSEVVGNDSEVGRSLLETQDPMSGDRIPSATLEDDLEDWRSPTMYRLHLFGGDRSTTRSTI
ncbi:MAG: hypothetical protein HC832_08625 [Leptolyngbyaceae cyanobacterium RM1_405_57]|nr:hypothetical protein [Leptolyngbyaceae cyanobacterium RM1_405_57]